MTNELALVAPLSLAPKGKGPGLCVAVEERFGLFPCPTGKPEFAKRLGIGCNYPLAGVFGKQRSSARHLPINVGMVITKYPDHGPHNNWVQAA
jgi:hypothetical protein